MTLFTLLFILPSTARGADGLPDLLAYPSPDAWYADLRTADAQTALLVRPALQGTSTSSESRSPRVDLATVRARQIALQRTEREARLVAEQLSARRDLLNERETAHRTTEADLQSRASAASAATREALNATSCLTHGARRGPCQALARWAQVYTGIDWARAFGQDGGLLPLKGAEDQLRQARVGTPDPLGGAIDDLLAQSADEVSARLELQRHQLSFESSQDEIQRVEMEIADTDMTLNRASQELLSLRAREDELVENLRGVAAEGDADLPLEELDGLYGQLQSQLDMLPAGITTEAWCGIWVHGALVRLARGAAGAEEMLRRAATTREDSCRPAVSPWLDLPAVQVAWADARFQAVEGAPVTLILEATGGRWRVDGLPVATLGTVTLDLRPGLHRVELDSQDGSFFWAIEELQPGERIAWWATIDGLQQAPLPPGVASARPSLPPHDRIYLVDGVAGAAPPKGDPRMRLSASGSMARFPDLADGIGVGVDLSPILRAGDRLQLTLDLGADVWHSTNSELFPITRTLMLPILVHSRAGVGLHLPLSAPVTPSLSVYGTMLNGTAAGLGSDIRVEWTLTDQTGIEASFGGDLTWQFLDGQRFPGLHGGVGLTRWM